MYLSMRDCSVWVWRVLLEVRIVEELGALSVLMGVITVEGTFLCLYKGLGSSIRPSILLMGTEWWKT